MTTFEPTCTEPGRWDRAPDAEASASEILAYLQHCDGCAYHTRLVDEEDRPLDLLLQEACRDLVVDDVVLPGATGKPARARPLLPRLRRRAPAARYEQQRARFEQRLTQACILAFGIVVLFISFTAYQLDLGRPAQATVAEADALPGIDEPLSGRLLEVINQGRLYVSRVISDSYDGQRTRGGVLYNKDQLTAVIPHLADGSILRVTNPHNGISVLVKVVDRSSVEREVYLSSSAADSLGLDDTAIVFVEVLSEPPPVAIGP